MRLVEEAAFAVEFLRPQVTMSEQGFLVHEHRFRVRKVAAQVREDAEPMTVDVAPIDEAPPAQPCSAAEKRDRPSLAPENDTPCHSGKGLEGALVFAYDDDIAVNVGSMEVATGNGKVADAERPMLVRVEQAKADQRITGHKPVPPFEPTPDYPAGTPIKGLLRHGPGQHDVEDLLVVFDELRVDSRHCYLPKTYPGARVVQEITDYVQQRPPFCGVLDGDKRLGLHQREQFRRLSRSPFGY